MSVMRGHHLSVGILHLMLRVLPFTSPASGTENKQSEVMSDHLFLGASLTAILTTECLLAYQELKRALQQSFKEPARLAFLGLGIVLCCFSSIRNALFCTNDDLTLDLKKVA